MYKPLIIIALLVLGGASLNANAPPKPPTTGIGEERPYTIMIYMNGSDLETEIGAGTEDLKEMLGSGLNSQNAHVIVFTGGSLYWHNDRVPANECVLWAIADGHLLELERVGLQNMGDPATLTGFIRYTLDNFPAQKYGLIMWDHGGGAIAGFGQIGRAHV